MLFRAAYAARAGDHPTPTYVKQVVENFRRDFRLSILQQLNLQAHNLTQLIQLEHALWYKPQQLQPYHG